MSGFIEVAERVWVARHTWFDVNVTAVEGERGVVLVDTHASAAAARGVLGELRRVTRAPLLTAVNTHQHFDHTFGNGVMVAEGAELVCHEDAAATLPAHAEEVRRSAAADPDERMREVAETEVVVPQRTFSSALVLDLGDRAVELVHPGRGHTGGDLVVRIEDADVVLAGDLVEESAAPAYGDDCWPMEWPASLDLVLNLVGPGTVVVPGHGAPVDREFVQDQRADIGIVAETLRDLAGRGVPVGQALEVGEWPFPAAGLEVAVRRAYEQLPRSQKRLPLI